MKIARIMGLVAVAALWPAEASAGGHKRHGRDGTPAEAYPAAMPTAYTSPVAFAQPLADPWCYALPIQAVYQFPAVLANQPGAEVGWLEMNLRPGVLGGQPYLYHP